MVLDLNSGFFGSKIRQGMAGGRRADFLYLKRGIGVILTYASYLPKGDDVVLSGTTAAATNEVAEVIWAAVLLFRRHSYFSVRWISKPSLNPVSSI